MIASRPLLFFIRHGETDWNAEGRFQGQRDIPLNDLGRVQAEECGTKLARVAARLGFDIGDLSYVASPLSRTRETMEIARASMGLPPDTYRQDERFKELSFGAWEGYTIRELTKRDPEGLKARDIDRWHYAPPGGENYVDLTARIAPAVSDINRPAVIVAHGGTARALFALTGVADRGAALSMEITQGVVFVVGPRGLERH
jgi:probable phosphoglycerate mutase